MKCARLMQAVLALTCVASAGLCAPQETPPIVESAIGRRVDEYLNRCVPFGFSGAVLLADREKVLLCKGYGCADRKTGSMCTSGTLFDVGALTKEFTAALVFALEQRGALNVTDTIDRFLEDVPSSKRTIQIRHLLTETSGLPSNLPAIGSATVDRAAMIRAILSTPLESEPGKRRTYGDADYLLLAAIIERAAKQPFDEALRKLVLEPAGLSDTGTRRSGLLDASRSARGWSELDEPVPLGSLLETDPSRFEGHGDEKLLATDGWYSCGIRGAGGVITTVEDFWKWERVLRGDSLLNAGSRDKFLALDPDVYGRKERAPKSSSDVKWICHHGKTANGFEAECNRNPDRHGLLVLLCNVQESVISVRRDIELIMNVIPYELPPATTRLTDVEQRAWVGEFTGSGGEAFRVRAFGSDLLLEAMNESAFRFLGPHRGRFAEHPELLERSRTIAAGFEKRDFTAFRAAAGPEDLVSFGDEFWRRLFEHHGPLAQASVLGEDMGVDGVVKVRVALEFERGCEILTLTWLRSWLRDADIGPPFPDKVRLVPSSANSTLAYSLVQSRVTHRATLVATESSATIEIDGLALSRK